MALQPFVGPWSLLQFSNLFDIDGWTPWTGDQAIARPLSTHRTAQTYKISYTDIHSLSGIGTHDPSIRATEDSSCLSAATMIGTCLYKFIKKSDRNAVPWHFRTMTATNAILILECFEVLCFCSLPEWWNHKLLVTGHSNSGSEHL
jgi:hypothetical protein